MATWWLNWHDLTTLGNFMDNFWALLRTISSQFRDNWPTTLGHLWDKFKTTSKQLRDNFWTILRQFRDTFETAWRQHYDNFETKKRNQIDNFKTTLGNLETSLKQPGNSCVYTNALWAAYMVIDHVYHIWCDIYACLWTDDNNSWPSFDWFCAQMARQNKLAYQGLSMTAQIFRTMCNHKIKNLQSTN